ncbi:MAG: hypothetical protein OHK0015_09450 [Chloroflexi bacterium OHK40]
MLGIREDPQGEPEDHPRIAAVEQLKGLAITHSNTLHEQLIARCAAMSALVRETSHNRPYHYLRSYTALWMHDTALRLRSGVYYTR